MQTRNIAGLVMATILLATLLPDVQAQTNNNLSATAAGDCQKVAQATIAAIALGSSAGNIDATIDYPCQPVPVSSTAITWGWNIDGPSLLAGGVAGTSAAFTKTYTGCTVSGADTQVNDISVTDDHVIFTSRFTFDSGSRFCDVQTTVTFTTATVSITHLRFHFQVYQEKNFELQYQCGASQTTPFNFNFNSISCLDPQVNNFNILCGATSATPNTFDPAATLCTIPQIDNLNRLCAASAFTTPCTTAQLDILDRWCAASSFGTTCTTPDAGIHGNLGIQTNPTAHCFPQLPTGTPLSGGGTFNTLNGGTLCIDYPEVVAPGTTFPIEVYGLTPSGTLSDNPTITGGFVDCSFATGSTITGLNTNLGITRSKTIDIHMIGTQCSGYWEARIQANGATTDTYKVYLPFLIRTTASTSTSTTISGSLTVHQDPLSGTVNVSPLSGTLTVHQDQACGSTIHCKVDTNATVNVSGNVSTNNIFPSTLHLCGPATPINPCPSINTASTASFGADGLLDVFILAAIGAWLWAASTLLPVRILGIIVEFYAGFRAWTMRPQPYGHDAVAILFWLVAAIFALHMSLSLLRDNIKKRNETKDPIEGDPA